MIYGVAWSLGKTNFLSMKCIWPQSEFDETHEKKNNQQIRLTGSKFSCSS